MMQVCISFTVTDCFQSCTHHVNQISTVSKYIRVGKKEVCEK